MSITPHVQANAIPFRDWPAVPLRHSPGRVTLPSPPGGTDEQFITMLNGYRSSGGLARAPEVASLCQSHNGPSTYTLAQWIFKRSVVNFEWQSNIWLPLFQFRHVDMSRQPGLEESLSELALVYDDWDVARWFSLPNARLAERTPADTLSASLPEVLNAAHAERHHAAAFWLG